MTGDGHVMGDRHFDPRKAQALTGAAVGSATVAIGAVASLATEGWPPSLLALLCMDNAFWLLIACSTAGAESAKCMCVCVMFCCRNHPLLEPGLRFLSSRPVVVMDQECGCHLQKNMTMAGTSQRLLLSAYAR